MTELKLNVYLFCESDRLEKLLKSVQVSEEITCFFFTEDSSKVESQSLVITDDPHRLTMMCSSSGSEVSYAFFGNEEDLPKDVQSTCLEDVWRKTDSDVILCFRFSRLLEKLKARFDAWLYNNLLTATIDSMPEMVWYKNTDGAYLIVNDQFCKTVHKTKAQVEGKDHCFIWNIPHEDWVKSKFVCRESDKAVMQKKTTCIFEEAVKTKEGMKQLRTYKSPLFDRSGNVMGTIGIADDVTDFSNIGSELSILIENLPFPLAVCDKGWKLVRMNYIFKETFRTEGAGMIGEDYHEWKRNTFCENTPSKQILGETSTEEITMRGEENRIFQLKEHEIIDSFGYVSGYYCLFSDITVQRCYESRIMQLANTDELTKLCNRRYLYSYAKQHKNEPMTVFNMDLDRFKRINDTFGHKRGDFVLTITARQILRVFPDGVAARMGGDEFMVILCGSYSLEEMQNRAKLLQANVTKTLAKNFGKVTISVGISQSNGPDKDIDTLMTESDMQMYQNKQAARAAR